jgi:signal transduction histidine kinase/putative methionine-R-sulfoxide reductase with GAF domain
MSSAPEESPHKPRPMYLPPQESLSGALAPRPLSTEERLAQLELSSERHHLQLEGLLNIAATLRQHADPQAAMRAIMVQISELLQADRTTIYELSEDQVMLQGLAVQGDLSVSVGIPNGRGIAGLVAATKRPINLADAYEHPSFDLRFDRLTGYRTRSVLCVPMLSSQGEVIGVVQVLNKLNGGAFSHEDKQLLIVLAAQAAMTLEALRLEQALKSSNANLLRMSAQVQRQLEEQELLFEVERAASTCDTLADLASAVLERATRVIGADLVALFVPHDEGYGPAYLQEREPTRGGLGGCVKLNESGLHLLARVDVGEGLLGKIASRGEALMLLGECFELEALPRALSDRCDYPVHNTLAIPLIEDRAPIGALLCVNCEALNGWEPTPGARGDSLLDLGGATLNIRQLACFDGLPAAVRERASQTLRFAGLIAGRVAHAAAQLERRRTALTQDRMMTIGQMLSGVLHDMRGPMTAISGYSQLMARSSSAEERAMMAATVTRKIRELNEMTLEVLNFAKGSRTVLTRKVFLKQFTDHILESLLPEFEEFGVRFEVDDQTSGVGYFDEGKMRRVVINIARNARQAMSHAPSRADGEAWRCVWRLRGSPEGLVFEITDNGPGIPEVIRERVFEAFTTLNKAEGTGLGLAIVKRIVDEHEGRLALTTETGVGTSILITLPQPAEG